MRVIGVDLSEGMLDVAREYAREKGVAALVDLRRRRHPRPARDGAGAARDLPVPLAAAHDR